MTCTTDELAIFQPPNGTSCQDYAANFLRTATGFLLNPDAIANCVYCRYKNGQSYVSSPLPFRHSLNCRVIANSSLQYIQWGYDFVNRYKNVGIFIGFIAFNYTVVIMLTYLTKVKKWKKA